MGEANMASGQTLVDFVTWAMQSYPADKYVLILSDHGMGWPGGWSDPTCQRQQKQVYRFKPVWETSYTLMSWIQRWVRFAHRPGWISSR